MPTWGSKTIRTWFVALLALAGAVLGVSTSLAAVTANPTPTCTNNICTVTFAAGNEYSYTVPAGTPVTMTIKGARGGNGGNDSSAGGTGVGGEVVSFTVTSNGSAYSIYPGNSGSGGGSAATGSGAGAGGTSAYPNGAYNGGNGAAAGNSGSSGGGGGGGAASVVQQGTTLYIAGGGGGAGGGNNGCGGSNGNAYSSSFVNTSGVGTAGAYPGNVDGSGGGGGGGGLLGGRGGTLSVIPACSGEQHGGGGYTGSNSVPAGATVTANGNLAAGSVTFSWPDQVTSTLVPANVNTNSRTFSYTLTFPESVTGLTASDFAISGTATGCTVSSVTGSGTTYTITVSGCAAATVDKTVILDLLANSVTTTGGRINLPMTAATVTIDPNAPSLVITAPSPYAERTYFDFTITGNEPLAGYDISDFTLTGGSCTLDTVTGAGNVLTVHVIGCTHLDVTKLTIKAGSLTDLAGNTAPTAALSSANETVNIPAAPAMLTNTVVTGEQSTGVQQGITLTMTPGTFSPAGRNVLTTTWYRCYTAQASASATLASDCQVIIGATATTYTTTQNDVGYYLRAVATATNATGTILSASANTSVVRETDVLSSTWYATCVIKEGLVYCWGDNPYGQMGDGTTTDVLSPPAQPVKLANGNYLTGVVSVDTASEHTCALTYQGAMYCWGRNNWSQLGDGTTVAKSVATPVSATATGGVGFTSDVVAISAGEAHTCALKRGGAAYCWGDNDYGQLGDGSTTTRVPPTQLLTAASTPLTNITDIEINRYNACALSNSGGVTGQIYCTGFNGNGAVGDGTATNRSYATKVNTSATTAGYVGATDISVGSHTICAVQSGAAMCWGYNNAGQVGNGNTTSVSYPTQVINTAATPAISFASGVVRVETSKNYPASSCFLKDTGALYCVGQGTSGQLTDGTIVSKTTPVASTMFTTGTTTMSLGDLFTCAIDASGLSCVGSNTQGQLGNGTIVNSTTEVTQPVFDLHLGAVDEIPVPGANTLTGFAGSGQVLTGATTVETATGSWYGYPLPALTYQWLRCTLPAAASTSVPNDCTPIAGATSLTYTATASDVGRYLRFETIGTNSAGVSVSVSANSPLVGTAPANSALPSITLNSGSAGAIEGYSATVTAGTWTGTPNPTITYKWFRCSATGASSTLTLPSDCAYITDATGTNYKFTASDVGYYIRGVEVASSSAGVNYAYTATVGPIAQSRVIAAGYNHTCVIKLGFVYCWGYNGYGQLGDGTTTSTNSMPATPVKLADGSYLKNVESIDASANSTCALTAAGAMYCWGYNGYGELGDGTTTNRSVPTLVSGLSSGVSYMMTSVAHTCAVKTNGSLYCWGLNDNGQVGDNTSTQRTSPVQVITATNTPITDVIQVSGGWKHTCAIKVGGALFCWGYNGNGMVGDNSVTSRWMPTAVVGMSSGVTDVSASYYYTCAVKNGAAWCWGYNANGQLGDGTVTQRQVPVAVVDSAAGMTFASGVWDVETSDYDPGYTCFTKQSGRIYCTGANAQGQLGTGNTTEFNKPTAPSLFPGTVTASALGRYHTCVIMDARVSCIGYNVNGELGNGANTSTSTVLATQTAFGNPSGAIDVLPVSGGATQTGYVGVGQTVTGATTLDPITGTWAGYSYPTLAYQWLRCNLTGAAAAAVPGDCTPISGATSLTYTVTAGDNGKFLRFEVLGTNSVGTVIAVSANSAAVGSAPTNTVLPGISSNAGYAGSITGDVATVSAGTWTGTPTPTLSYKWYRCAGSAADATTTTPTDCVIIAGATGANYTYTASDVGSYIRGIEVAESTSGISYAYTASVGPVRQSDELTAGYLHNCVIKLGMVYCWGYNASGQLGDGTTTNSSVIPSVPVKTSTGEYLKDVVSISAGTSTTCALTIGGAVYCWGNNQYGQLGDGTTTSRSVATPVTTTTVANGSVSFSSGVTAIAVGTHQTCAVKNGAVYCWGYGGNGNIGDGTTVNKSVPTPSLILTSGVTQINSQDQTICAIKAGALYCWGYNAYGQLVDGTVTSKSSPVLISQLSSGVTDVDVGFYNVCAIKNGAAFCWGYNYNYVLGDGTATNRAVPTPVASSVSGVAFDSQVVDVTVSDHHDPSHACAIKQDGKAYCWGDNTYGQLGDLTTTASSRPVFAAGFAGKVSATAMTYTTTCMIVDGAVKCVGYNAQGQVGNGTTTNTTTPFGPVSLTSGIGSFDVLPTAGPATLTGYAGTGETLTGATVLDPLTGTWKGFSAPVLTYQWLRCSATGVAASAVPADCVKIAGATSITYQPTLFDVDKYLRFEVIGTNSAGVSLAVSAATAPVGISPTNTNLPTLKDIDGGYAGPIPGVVESINPGSWSGTPTPTVSYQWYRCLTAIGAASVTAPSNGDCWTIDSATTKNYTLTASDVGYYVVGVEVGSSTSGVNKAFTQSTALVRESDSISAGDSHTCAVRLGRVYCWGLGTSGQLGDGTLVSKSVATGPVKFADGSILENVVSVESQDTATCAFTTAGLAYCWGTQANGEFGDGLTTETTSTPKQILLAANTPLTGVIALSASSSSTCVIRTGGSLWCWGYNTNGQVGDGTTTQRVYPVQIISSGVQQVSQDLETTCAIVNGALKCWGYNYYNELGDGTGTNRLSPTQVTGLTSGVTDVSVGYIHTCAIKDGAAFCWGYNGYGQLGDGTTTQRAVPTQVANSAAGVVFTDDVVNIDASEYNAEHTCLTKTGGVLYCFGVGGNSALANGSTANALVPSPSTLWTTGVSEVTTGYQFTCVVKDGADFCTGYNNYGQTGNGNVTTIATSNPITAIANYAGALDVAPFGGDATISGTPAVGATVTGASAGWLGFPMPTVTYQWYNCTQSGATVAGVPQDCIAISGATSTTYVPTTADVGNYLRFVATGNSVAGTTVVSSATVLAGTLPDATFIERTSAPANFMPIGTVINQFKDEWAGSPTPTVTNAWYRCASSGAATETVPSDCTLIAGATGATYTTTQSDVGSYIRGAQVATNSLGTTTALSPTAGYVTETRSVAVGAETTCVVKAGEVWCAGVGTAGQLGNNASLSSTTPVKVLTDATTPLTNVVDVAGVGYHFCALTESGALYCWGANTNGAIGNGTTTAVNKATLITSGTKYAAVDPGNGYTCAIKVGGALYCWGLATSGQLGDGTVVSKNVPTLVSGMGSGVSQVSAGWQSTCAIKNGAAMCWGSNTNYMLGDGTVTARTVPTQVGPTQVSPIVNFTSGVTDIAMSTISACLVKDGSLYCWGNAAVGQIGTGATSGNAGYPVQVIATTSGTVFTSGVADVEVSVNNNSIDSVYVTKADGSLYAFGSQVNGVLFNSLTTSFSARPIAATGFASGVSEVSAGWGDVCVVKSGALNCVGLSSSGQLMNNPSAPIAATITTAIAPAAFGSALGDVALAPSVVVAPSVDGTPGIGNASYGDPGAFAANPDSTETYQWYVCTLTGDVATSVPGDCVLATGAGATTTAYTPVPTDSGKYLRLAVTATNSAGTVTSVSAVSAQVTGKGDQVITITAPASLVAGALASNVSAVSDMGTAVTLSSATPLVCTVAAGKVTPVSAGRCQIDATSAATTYYNAGSTSVELYVSAVSQTITFAPADRPFSASTATLSATSTSSLPVSYASSTPAICTVSGSTLTYVNVGTCTITASQAGNSVYAAATPVTASFQVTKATQTITFTPPAALSTFDTAGWALTATSTSGGSITYTVADPAICNIVNGKLVAVAVGTCSVTAWQAGDTKYSPANVTATLQVVTAPEVSVVSTTAANPTNVSTIPVAVSFTSPVTGFALADISVVPAGACTVASLAGSGANYTFNLTGCVAGSVAIKIAANSVTNGSTGPSVAYTSETLTVIDKTAPAVSSGVAVSPANTNALPISYTVTFAEAVTGFTAADLTVTGTATGCVATVTPVSSTVYTVSFASCTDGTVGFNVAANAVTDTAGNAGPTAAYTVAAAVRLDRVVPAVTSITTTTPALTNAATVSYTVTFPEAVTGFTAADVATTGTSTGCVATVTPVSATVYTVALASCSDGTLGLKVLADSVTDVAGNLGPAAEFTTAGTITIDRTGPAIASVTTTAPALTNTLPVPFVVTFADAVTGFTAADVSTVGTATGCVPTVTAVSATVYNVTLASCGNGTVGLSIAASSVTDSANNSGPLLPYAGQVLTTIDRVAPAVSTATTAAVNPTNADNLVYTVTFAEAVTGFGAADVATLGTADNCNISVSKVSDTVYSVTLSLCGDGTVGVQVLANSVADAAGNAGPAAAFNSALINIDRTAPDAPEVVNLPIPYTNATSVNPTFVAEATLVYNCTFDGVPVANTVTCNNGNMTFSQLTPGTHTLVVTATDAAGNVSDPYTGTFEVGTFETPEAPDAPVIERTSLNRMLVTWNEPAASDELPVTGYRLEYTIDSNTWLPIATNGTETSVDIPATSGTVYKFRVKALSGVSPLDASPFSAESPYVAMYLPNIVTLNLGSSTLVPPTGTTLTITGQDFKVNGSTDNSGTVVTFGTIPAQVLNVAPDGTSVTVKVPTSPVEQVVDLTVTVGSGEFQNASVSHQAFRYVTTKVNQVLTHTPPIGLLVGGPDAALDASFNSLVSPVIAIAADSKTICSVVSGKIHALKVGTCNYTVSAPAVGAYNAYAAKAFKLTVGKGLNTTTLILPDSFADGEVGITSAVTTLDANSTSGLPITFKASPDTVCFVDGFNGLHLVAQGACTVTATSGSADYATSVDTETFNVVRAAQTFTFVQPGALIPDTTTTAEPATDKPTGFHLVAAASSGLPLTYESRNPEVCDVDENGVVIWIGNPATAGQNLCDIAINQAGDANYDALPEQIVHLTATPFIGPKPAPGSAVTEPSESVTLSGKGGTLKSGSESVGIKITSTGVTLNVVSLSVLTGQLTSTYTIPYTYKDKKGKVVKTKQVCTVKFGITKVLPIATAAQKKIAYSPKQYKSATCALNKEAFAYFKAGNALVITQLLTKDFHWPTTFKTVIGADAKLAGKPFSLRIGKPLYLFKKTTTIRVEPPVK